MKSSIFIAGMLMISMVPLDPKIIDTLFIMSLFGASRTLMKSYGPNNEYCWRTLAPNASISLFTSLILSGFSKIVRLPSGVSFDTRIYVGKILPQLLFGFKIYQFFVW